METETAQNPGDASPDRDDRVRDFLARHGGSRDIAPRAGESQAGLKGWSEVYAADGYTLRCDWSKFGGKREMTYSEVAPRIAR
jgi:hypothetical protein